MGQSAHEEATQHAVVRLELLFEPPPQGDLPLSSQHMLLSVGDTFAQLKKRLAESHGWTFSDVSLFVGNLLLLDPLCLSDVPQLRGLEEVTIRVVRRIK